MGHNKISMFTKKVYEFEQLRDKIKEEFDKNHIFIEVEFKDEILREIKDVKILLLIYEKWFARTSSYASLTIMISESEGYQYADLIASGGRDDFFSYGVERDFSKSGENVLKILGFQLNTD